MAVRVVVAYDVSDDRRRAATAAHLTRVGVRLQRSVFECELPGNDDVDALLAELERVVDLNRDVVHVFRQCADCGTARRSLGQAPEDLHSRWWIV